MISSHILSELAEMCTHIGIIEAGKLLASGEVDEIMHGLQPHRTIEIHVLHAADEAVELLRALPGVRDVRGQWEPGSAPPSSSNGAGPSPVVATAGEALDAVPLATTTAAAQRVVLLVDYIGDEAGLGSLLQHLIVAGVPVVHFAAQASDLEDIFMRVTQGVTQ
jgi:ABC-2 type transport system ATP-binding protein